MQMREVNADPVRVHGFAAATAIGIAIFIVSSCAQSAAPLWKPIQWQGRVIPTPQAIRSQAVEMNIQRLQPPSNERITLALPDGRTVTAVKSVFQDLGKQQFIWRGTIEGDKRSVVTFSVVNDNLAGDIVTSRGGMFRVRFAAPHVHVIEQLDPSKFPPEERGIRAKSPSASNERILLALPAVEPQPPSDGNPVIDVMVFYTPKARDFANGADSITAIINEVVSDTNTSYTNSGIQQRIQLVHAEEIAYVEKGDIAADLNVLKGTASDDNEINQVHDLRQACGADIVVLITDKSLPDESCGQAYQMHSVSTAFRDHAFAVVPINCATGVYSFAHELGHIMGADHNDAAGTDSPPFPYSRGYEVLPSKDWHTIMASRTVTCTADACPPRVLYWSNPLVNYLSEPTGISKVADNPADNALALNNTASTVANFYPASACGAKPTPPGGISVQ
jgi:hypothetical protein